MTCPGHSMTISSIVYIRHVLYVSLNKQPMRDVQEKVVQIKLLLKDELT